MKKIPFISLMCLFYFAIDSCALDVDYLDNDPDYLEWVEEYNVEYDRHINEFIQLESQSSVMGGPDPQNLAPQKLECYCKFIQQDKVESVPESARNNLDEASLMENSAEIKTARDYVSSWTTENGIQRSEYLK